MPSKIYVHYRGIDYGSSCTNIDTETQIRFGIIPQHDIIDQWAEISEPEYGEMACPYCGSFCIEETKVHDRMRCDDCAEIFHIDDIFGEPTHYIYDQDGYKLIQRADDTDIFVVKSPFYTWAQFCSPCAPGACHLHYPLAETSRHPDNKCYCLPHSWFNDEIAPYDVFCISDGTKLLHEKE